MTTMPNERPGVPMWIENTLELPRMCPVSGNPQPGSRLTICYRPGRWVLEVYALKAYLQRFVGGHPDGTRNMEAALQKVAQEAADALEVSVRVLAELILNPDQRMRVICRARPHEILSRHPRRELALPGNGTAVRLPAAAVPAEAPTAGDM